MSFLLTREELIELTGKQTSPAQVLVLRHMGIEHRVRPDGTVAVNRECAARVLGATTRSDVLPSCVAPNWSDP